MARRNRIIYPSQSVWANGNILYRVQTFGSTTTFNTEDIFELGQLNLVDVVDDAPTVAVTIEANEFGAVSNLYALANITYDGVVNHSAVAASGHLTVVSGLGVSGVNIAFYHGVTLSDFGLSNCATGSAVEIWAPVQNECSLGTTNNVIDQTMFLPRVFINSIAWTYTAGANATEHFGGETDSKFWFVNNGKFISNEEFVLGGAGGQAVDFAGVTGGTGVTLSTSVTSVFLGLDPAPATGPAQLVATRSTGQSAFLRFDSAGNPAVRYFSFTANLSVDIQVLPGTAAQAGAWTYNSANNQLFIPTDLFTNVAFGLSAFTAGNKDVILPLYAANAPGVTFSKLSAATQAARGGSIATANMATRLSSDYFAPISFTDLVGGAENITGSVRQGQVEIYLIDKSVLATNASIDAQLALRLTSVTITADLARTPLFELSHLRPYDRALVFPIPFTVAVETTATDLTEYSTFASKKTGFQAGTTADISIYDFMTADKRLDLVVFIYRQTDQTAGGVGTGRRVLTREMVGDAFYERGQRFFYYTLQADPDTGLVYGTSIPAVPTKTNTPRERPLKTVIAKNLRITDEAYNLALGSNATQHYGFRGKNDIFVILGEVPVADLVVSPGFQINPAASRVI